MKTSKRNVHILTLSFILVFPIFLISCVVEREDASYTSQITLYSNETPKDEVDFSTDKQTVLENLQAFFDFDEGDITNTEKADIYLEVGCGTDCFNNILEINGSQAVDVGLIQPSYDECIKALSVKQYPWVINVPNNYSCLQTNEGKIVRILALENESHTKDATFTFEYTIWYKEP